MPNFETPSETAEQKSARTGLFSRTNYWMANGGATDMDNLRANLTKDTKVPDAMMTALRADLEADATAHPDRYGLAGVPVADLPDRITSMLNDHESYLQKTLIEAPAWAVGVKLKNIDDLVEDMKTRFDLQPREAQQVTRELEDKTPYFVEGLLESAGKQRAYLKQLIDRNIKDVDYGAFGELCNKMYKEHVESEDPDVLNAIEQIQRLRAGQTCDVDAISAYFRNAKLDANEYTLILKEFVPSISMKEMAELDADLARKVYDDIYDKVNEKFAPAGISNVGELAENEHHMNRAARLNDEGVRIATLNLDPEIQRDIVNQFAARGWYRGVRSSYPAPNQFNVQLDYSLFDVFFENSAIHDTTATPPRSPSEAITVDYSSTLPGGVTSDIGRAGSLAGFVSSLQTWEQNYNNIHGVSNLQEGAVIKTRVMHKGKPSERYYKITSLPEYDITRDEADLDVRNDVQLQILGEKDEGVKLDSQHMVHKNYTDLFMFLTREVDDAEFMQDAPDGVSSQWSEYREEKKIHETQSFDGEFPYNHERFQARIGEIIGENSFNFEEGCTFEINRGPKDAHVFSVVGINKINGEFTIDQGHGGESGEREIKASAAEFLALFEGTSRENITYLGDQPLSLDTVLAELKKDESTGKVFEGMYAQKNGLFRGTEDKHDESEEIKVIKIDGGDDRDIFIHSIKGDEAEVSLGFFTPHQVPTMRNKEFVPPKWEENKGSRQKIHVQSLLGYIRGHKPKAALPVVEEIQEDKPIQEGKGGFWAGIKALHRFGAIPYAFKKPFEAIKKEHERDMEVYGNLGAYLIMDKVPFIGKFDWSTSLMANTSKTIKSQMEQAVEEIGNAYSSRRQDIIYKWATKYPMPHFKFIAAMLGTLAEYGTFYYGANAKRLPPYYFVNKVLGLKTPSKPPYLDLKSPTIQSLLKQAGGFPPDHPDITEEEFGSINEIHLTHVAFAAVTKKYPQYSNLYRMMDKQIGKGVEGGKHGGKGNMESRSDRHGRQEWLLEQIVDGRLTEFVSGIHDVWFEETYDAEDYMLPLMAFVTTNRVSQCPKTTLETFKEMYKKGGIHIPYFMFLEDASEMVTFRNAMVQIAYLISPDAGNTMKELIEGTNQCPAFGKAGKEHVNKLDDFWKRYGKEMTQKLCGTKDPAVLMMIEQDKEAKGKDEKGVLYEFGDLDQKYRDSLHSYVQTIEQRLGEENAQTYRGTSYDKDFFRFSADVGFPIWFLNDTYTYFDKNFNNTAYWEGRSPLEGDGIWNEFLKSVKNIPDASEKMVQRYMESTGKKLSETDQKKMKSKFAYSVYKRIRMGPHGSSGAWHVFERGNNQNAMKATYWGNDALIYGIVGPKEMPCDETNVLDKFSYWEQLSNNFGLVGPYRDRSGDEKTAVAKAKEAGRRVAGDVPQAVFDTIDGNRAPELRKAVPARSGTPSSGTGIDDTDLKQLGSHNYLRHILGYPFAELDGNRQKELDISKDEFINRLEKKGKLPEDASAQSEEEF